MRSLRRIAGLIIALTLAFGGTALASPARIPLGDRLIHSSEFPGFVPQSSTTTTYTTPEEWVTGNGYTGARRTATVTRLRSEGFVAAISQGLGTAAKEPWNGLCWVMQLRSANAARDELAAFLQSQKSAAKSPNTFQVFQVDGIPGAKGFEEGRTSTVIYDTIFADGPFLYLLSVGWTGRPTNPPTERQLIAAAGRLDKRVHGHPA